MKRNSLLVILLVFTIPLFGQTEEKETYSVDQIQGIWQMYANYTYPTEDSYYKTFHIFKGRKRLTIQMDLDVYERLSVVVTQYGFADSHKRDEICAMDSLKKSGFVFVSMAENRELMDCRISIADVFELKEKSYLNIFSDQCDYIDKAPKEVLDFIYKRGKRDKRDYAKEFLDLQIYGIRVDKSMIYDTTQNKTKMYLVKNDVVIVTGEDKRFLKIEYETAKGDIIKGYIKKEDAIGVLTNHTSSK